MKRKLRLISAIIILLYIMWSVCVIIVISFIINGIVISEFNILALIALPIAIIYEIANLSDYIV